MPLRSFVRQRLDELKITPTEAERRGGLAKGFIGDILRGTKKNVSGQNVALLAKALSVEANEVVLAASGILLTGSLQKIESPPPTGVDGGGSTVSPYPGAIPEAEARIGAGGFGLPVVTHSRNDRGMTTALDVVRGWWGIPEEIVRSMLRTESENLVIMRVMSDSMEPDIMRTDYVLIDISQRTPGPEGIWALDNGFGLVLKRIFPKRTESGETRIVLRSANPKYADEEFSPDELTIVGQYKGRFTTF